MRSPHTVKSSPPACGSKRGVCSSTAGKTQHKPTEKKKEVRQPQPVR